MLQFYYIAVILSKKKNLIKIKFTGIHSKTFWVHAKTNRSRYPC